MKQYTVDAFTDKIFSGNPAAVCVLDKWLDEKTMMNLAMENNLSETAFVVKTDRGRYHLRWFTPTKEIDLCGHATLATSFILFNFYEKDADKIIYDTLSGELIVTRKGDMFEVDFPVYQMKKVPVTDEMEAAIGTRPIEAYMARDLVCVLSNEEEVLKYDPDPIKTAKLDGLLLHTTAKGTETDTVMRSFAPKLAVTEDPVCGSGHCHTMVIWAEKLNKNEMISFQASKRGGIVHCTLKGDRIYLAGKAALFAESEIHI